MQNIQEQLARKCYYLFYANASWLCFISTKMLGEFAVVLHTI